MVPSNRMDKILYLNVHYRPRSEASEGYVFTGVCHFNSGNYSQWAGDTLPTGMHTSILHVVLLCYCECKKYTQLGPHFFIYEKISTILDVFHVVGIVLYRLIYIPRENHMSSIVYGSSYIWSEKSTIKTSHRPL